MKVILNSEQETRALGQKCGQLLRGGEVIELIGDIGAGKTTFTKGVAEGMGVTDTIQSPTFTISRVYDAPSGIELCHYDFYRLSDAGIMADELQEASNNPHSVVIIEWGDIVREVLPQDYVEVHFSAISESVRELEFSANGIRSIELVKEMAP